MFSKKQTICVILFLFLTIPFFPARAQEANGFTWPFTRWEVTGIFGEKRDTTTYHLGTDAAGWAGTPVYSVANGYVRHIGIHSRFGAVILIEHTLTTGEAVVSLYGHLRMKNVVAKEGQYVHMGELIGYIASAGVENGGWAEHLHFGIHKGTYVPVEQKWVYWGLGNQKELDNWYDPTLFVQSHYTTSNDPYSMGKIITAPVSKKVLTSINLLKANGQPIPGTNILAFPEPARAGADVAFGDTNGDGIKEVITTGGSGSPPEIKIFQKGSDLLLNKFSPYPYPSTKGSRVTSCDVNNDGKEEIITTPASGGGNHVFVFDQIGNQLAHYRPFAKSKGGFDVACGNINGDNSKEIIISSGPGIKPEIIAYQNNLPISLSLHPFNKKYLGGLHVATGDIDGDGQDEIIVANAGKIASPSVEIFEGNGAKSKVIIKPHDKKFTGGLDVSTVMFDRINKEEIMIAPFTPGKSLVKIYRYDTTKAVLRARLYPYGKNYLDGINIAGTK